MAVTTSFKIQIIIAIAIVSYSTNISSVNSFQIEESTIQNIQKAFIENKLTSRELVDLYLQQIGTLNPLLHAVIEVNPDAQELADVADEKRKMKNGDFNSLGQLHGIPVLLKDTIGTKDKLNTTAGSFALLGSEVDRDAGVVERLRKAGAIILGKTSMSEWYRFRSLSGVPNGWCARAGQGLNPYVRSGSPCGSSSGSAISVASNMVAVALGTETHCSIICPADHNSVVGIKPTVGLTSRAGVIPMTPRWDTVGPIGRTVSDAVYVLDVIAGPDPRDGETNEASKFIPEGGYKQFLDEDGLKGKRLGVLIKPFLDVLFGSAELSAFENHINILRLRGATIVDDLEISDVDIILDSNQSGEFKIMLAEFKISINDYLKSLKNSPVSSLADVIAFNINNSELENLGEYDQQTFMAADKTDGFGEEEKKAVDATEKLTQNGFEKVMREKELDAIVSPGSRASPILAIGGYPAITVPAGYGIDGMPFGICFGGLKGSEPKLIQVAYAFEQASLVRTPPPSLSSL